jgi:hypothetical protein
MLEDRTILGIISNELSQSESYTDWEASLNYYLGNPDGKEVEGRSAVVSTDVADAIEWIMPQVMKSFTQNNEIVVFDPLGPQDEQQAEIESKYVYDVIMKENDGFIILHQFVKDALLQNNGIIKVFYEENTHTETQAFSGLSQEQIIACTQAPNVEVLEYDQDPLLGTFAVKIAITTNEGRISLESIPPEQFRYSANHNSINLDSCPFTAHVVRKTVSDLIKEGFDPDLLASIGDNSGYSDSSYRFNLQGEHFIDSYESEDPSLRTLDIAECFMQIDLNEDGVA